MIHRALHREIPVELTADRRITRRVQRLAAVSAVALGLIWALAVATLETPAAVEAVLFAGWLLMPSVLVASVVRPPFRYLLVLPAGLVSLGLLAIVAGWLPADPIASVGWLLVLAGVLLGGIMGMWFWYRIAPVPAGLDDLGSRGRWSLIVLHVTLIVLGLALAALPLVAA